MKNRKINLTKLFKIGILFFGISLLLWNCEKEEFIEETTIHQSLNEFDTKIQNQFNKKDFEKIVPFVFEVNWSKPERQYSKELETYFYEFPLNYFEERNPNSLNEKREKGYYIKFKLIVTESQIDSKEIKFNYFIAKFYQNIENSNKSLLDSKVNLNKNIGYKGITHLYDNKQELVFAKHITKSKKENNGEIYLDKGFRKENSLLAKGTGVPVEVCETKTIGVYKDIYRVIRDQWGNIIGYQYVTTILLYTYDKEVCYIKWIPQYVEGNGNGLFSNECDGGQICIIDVDEDLGCNTNLCNENVPDEIREAMLVFDSANILLTEEQYLWAKMNAEAVNSLAEYLRNALANNFDSVYIENIRLFSIRVINALINGTNFNNINFEDQIINNLKGKEKCAYDKLTNLNLFKSTIKKFEGNSNYNLILNSWTKNACNNSSDDGCTDARDLINGNITIYIQNIGRGTLDVAAIILHEGIHAEIYKYVDEYKKGLDPNDRKNLLAYYFQYKAQNDNTLLTSNAQHQHMADKYVRPIAEALRQLDNYKYPLNDYMGLAWDGLRRYGWDGYYDNGNWVTLDRNQYIGTINKILDNTDFNKNCN
jgi:hypothetical protein